MDPLCCCTAVFSIGKTPILVLFRISGSIGQVHAEEVSAPCPVSRQSQKSAPDRLQSLFVLQRFGLQGCFFK